MLKLRRYQSVLQTINHLLPSQRPALHTRNMGNYKPNRGGSNKPRLTHFLCIPLVNAISAPQLSKSLAEFKASIPLITPPAAAQAAAAGHVFQTPLVPDKAIRPLGTLHLTLGVMSLPDQTRLQEAVAFLDSLDLSSMLREAEVEASQSTSSSPEPAPAPLNITLTSLLALPNAKSATILHAHPLDPTSRFYPFCVKLRNKFIDAGFMHRDMVRDSRTGTEQPRPLLLHATICNTIYLGKRQRGGGGKNKSVYKFDATGLLERFGGEETDVNAKADTEIPNKAIPRALQDDQRSSQSDDGGKGKGKEPEYKVKPGEQGSAPFTWAKDIPIDTVCISEMGAKPVSDEVEGVVLGEAYKAVAKRRVLAS